MNRRIGQIALVVRDYDEAIDFYTKVLDFELLEDTKRSETKRWVVVKPQGKEGCALLLAKAKGEKQLNAVGNQTGGRVFLFLYTDDFEREYDLLVKHNVSIINGPRVEDFGKALVFEDPFGNKWDLIEYSAEQQ